jgi:biopolymer transport protein ExbB
MSEIVKLIVAGGVVMVPILVCSVTALAITIEKIIFWHKHRQTIAPEKLLEMAEHGNLKTMIEEAGETADPVAKVLLAGTSHRNPSPAAAMEGKAMDEIAAMKRYLPAMDTIITLAPLLGLLGTIIGMIQAFNVISPAGLSQPHAVTAGVAEALIATAAGLLVAITTLVPYNYFLAKTEKITDEMERYATKLEMILGSRDRPVEERGAVR